MSTKDRGCRIAVACFGFFLCGHLRAQVTNRVSVDSSAMQGNGESLTNGIAAISADGRYVVFESSANNLVGADTNGTNDVFVHDSSTGVTERVSVDSSGAEGNGSSAWASISADGRFVAFQSDANNLVAGDTNALTDCFVHDRLSGMTKRVSVDSSGAQANNGSSYPSISADGRYVAFESHSSNLVSADTNGAADVFVHDYIAGTTERVSVDSSGAQGNSDSTGISVSADGRYATFESNASNLVSGDTNALHDIFVHDRTSGTTERVSISSGGAEGNGFSSWTSISADGRCVAFISESANLVTGDTSNAWDVFVHDRVSGTTERVNVDSNGGQANGYSYHTSISADGRHVAFLSLANNLVIGDTNGYVDVFVRDRTSGTTERVSLHSSGGQANSNSTSPSISADGRRVAFANRATNLVSGDTNGFFDVFVREGRGSLTPFCFGDGVATNCPCGNSGSPGNGCASSINASGANLTATGAASVSADSLVLRGNGMPDSSALYFQGTALQAGGAGVAFGDGLRCAGGSVIRLGTKLNVFGSSLYPDAGDQAISLRGQIATPSVRTYQVWYRNAAAFCTPATFNFSNGVEVTWGQ